MSRKIKSCSFRSFRKLPALACLCGVLAGCAGGGGHTRTVRIGVALYSQDDTFISAVVQEIEQLARSRETAAISRSTSASRTAAATRPSSWSRSTACWTAAAMCCA